VWREREREERERERERECVKCEAALYVKTYLRRKKHSKLKNFIIIGHQQFAISHGQNKTVLRNSCTYITMGIGNSYRYYSSTVVVPSREECSIY